MSNSDYQVRAGRIFKGIVSRVAHAFGLQCVQAHGMRGKLLESIVHAMPHGFRSWVKPVDGEGKGAGVLMIEVAPDLVISIPVGDPRCQPEYAEEDTIIFDYRGQHVRLRADGIHIKGTNIYLDAGDGVIRASGRGIELHGKEYIQDDIAGFGKRRTHVGGNEFWDDTYALGAVVDGVDHGFAPPAIPTDHPVY